MSRFNGTRAPGFTPSFNGSFASNGSPPFPPDEPNTNAAPALLGVLGSLLLVSLVLVTARVWSRVRPSIRLYWDDWTVLAATILAAANYVINSLAVFNGFGRPGRFISFPRRRNALELLFVTQVVWYWSVTLIKLSVACLLFRLKHDSRRWRIFLYAVMIILILAVIVQTVFQFTQCRPFSVYWDPSVFLTGEVTCFRKSVINSNIIAFSCIQVASDVMLSLIPITFIRKLNRPRREKIFLAVLMGLGLFASFAAVMRTLTLQGFYTSRDLFESNISIVMWAMVEQQFGLIAATAPTLKAFFETTLTRIGLFFYDAGTETQTRDRLVQFGVLEDESGSKATKVMSSNTERKLSPKVEKKLRDEFGEFVVPVENDKDLEKMLEKEVN